jgi:cytochrome c peroxidase
MNTRIAAAITTILATLGGAVWAQQPSVTLSPALNEIAVVEAEIDRIEAQTLEGLAAPADNEVQQVELLGKAMLYDKNLSVNRNEACAFCHMPETGFTGPVSELNRTTGSYPGSLRTRFSNRKPQTHAYAPLSPVLHYNPGQDDLVGGNFWDMRATGRRLGNPAAEQAEGPPTNPVEMGLPDIACAVYRASQRPYRALFERKWGVQAFAIEWPADVEQVCNQPGPPPANDPTPVHLTELDRGRAAATFDQMAQSIAGYEASAEVTPFTSKFDAVLAGKAQFTPPEQAGYALFRGKAQCNNCHRDGGPGEDPLFTDFTASNIGTPANPTLPYYAEQQPDARGYAANPAGSGYVDPGVGGFLTERNYTISPTPSNTEQTRRNQMAAKRSSRMLGTIPTSPTSQESSICTGNFLNTPMTICRREVPSSLRFAGRQLDKVGIARRLMRAAESMLSLWHNHPTQWDLRTQ